MEEVEPDAQGDLQARDLGFGHDESSGYLPETAALDEHELKNKGVPEEIPIQEGRPDDEGT